MQNNAGINKVFLVGRIKTEPRRHKNFNNADTLCFLLVTTESFRKGDSQSDHEEHHHLIAYADNPDVKHCVLKNGNLVHVTGKIQTKSWVDEDQVRRYKTEILVLQLQQL